jgi:hypothetical protein
LFARSANPAINGMLPPVDATFGFSLTNTSGAISVLDGATVLDTVTWTSTTSGVSKALGSNHFSTTANDSAASFCPGTVPYGDNTNKGTPRRRTLVPVARQASPASHVILGVTATRRWAVVMRVWGSCWRSPPAAGSARSFDLGAGDAGCCGLSDLAG